MSTAGKGDQSTATQRCQFSVCALKGAITVHEERGRLDKDRDRQFSEVAGKQEGQSGEQRAAELIRDTFIPSSMSLVKL
jgi:hypothetical protein